MKILVTGGTNGMGKGVARILASSDNLMHEIIILCRSKERGETTLKEIEGSTGNNKISMVFCDLARLSNVRNAIDVIRDQHEFLDCIFVNAGLGYAARRIETEDGMDSHFQVNYLSQFMLTINLLDLLERSEEGGRVIFNVTKGGKIFWDDLQMKKKWGYEPGIRQAMVAKRLFCVCLHDLHRDIPGSKLSFIGFSIHKTVWSNQINIIPPFMKAMVSVMKWFGGFISMDECGMIMAPLFTEEQEESLKKSGRLMTWKKETFHEMGQNEIDLDKEMQSRLWRISMELCNDQRTTRIAEKLCI